ncbi:MAG: hypothetical protein B7Y45_08190 [Sphingomonas sp. 28-66-16]|nr:MAG: hypothetical protein B7Y45_08190 [Sphingomonas sp. 28-66-16]
MRNQPSNARARDLTISASILALSLAAFAAPASAQSTGGNGPAVSVVGDEAPIKADQAPNAGGDIVVTGSRIPRPNLESGQPTLVIDSKFIDERGYTNVADALKSLPSFGVPGSSRVGGQAGAFGSGQSFQNFFGLGDQRTLTVVNGRRFVSSNSASIFGPTGAGSQVDFNVLPTILVDRVETIAIGGAPIYGSDAIAGTINVITKRNFSGLQLDTQYGISERGDGADFRVRGLAGFNFAGGRGNITIAGEYNQQDGLTNAERPGLNSFFTTPLDPASPFRNTYITDRRIPALSQYGVPLVNDSIGFPLSPAQAAAFGGQPSVTNAAGQPLGFDITGNLVPIDFGQQTGNLINFNGGNGFVLPGNLLSPVRRYLATAVGEFKLTDNIRLFGEAWYANSRGEQLRDQPVYNTGLFDVAGAPDGNLILSVDNPYLNAAARQTIIASLASNPATDAAPGTFYLGRANTDLVSGAGASTVELYRFVGGADGSFRALGRDISFEISGNYGRSTTQGSERVLVQQNFANALNAVRDGSGNIVCAPGYTNANIATISSTCAPINPFGQQISQAARDYVTTTADPREINEQWVINANFSTNLFRVWGGDVGFVAGYEHRNESADFNPGLFYFGEVDPTDPTNRTQFGRSIPIDAVAGSFNTDEFFTELRVPLIDADVGIPAIRALELHGAARYIDNSLAGSDWTYTGDLRWEVVKGLAFRANYTRAVRAPAVTELFNPTSAIFTTANDPCDSRFLTSGPNPAVRQANCAAAGLPTNFQSNIVDFTTRGSLSGNTGLRNEISDATTFGAILQPPMIPGLSITADWVNVRLRGAIEALDADQVLQGCYDNNTYPTTLCSNFTRDAAGQITFIQTGYANAASRQFRGVIAQLTYERNTPFLGASSSVSFNGSYQYIDKLEVRVGAGDLTTLRNSIGYSPHKATVNVAYRNKGFFWTGQWQYYGATKNDPDAAPNAYEYPDVGSTSYFNSSIGTTIDKKLTLQFVVNNLFDTGAPFPVPANGGTVTYFDGVFGRNFRVSASVKF